MLWLQYAIYMYLSVMHTHTVYDNSRTRPISDVFIVFISNKSH